MTFKSIAAAAVTAAALFAFAGAASSEAANRAFGYNTVSTLCNPNGSNAGNCPSPPHRPPPPRYHTHDHGRFDFWFWYGSPYGGSPYYADPYYRPYGYYYGNGYPHYHAMSCTAAKSYLSRKGYRYIAATDCVGKYYEFTASKNGHKYRIRLNAYTGGYSRYLIR